MTPTSQAAYAPAMASTTTGTAFATRLVKRRPRPMKPPARERRRRFQPQRRRDSRVSDVDHLKVGHRIFDGAGIEMVEQEPRLRMPALELTSRFPAHMAEDVAGSRRLDDRHVRPLDQRVQRSGRLGVARIGEDAAIDLDAIAVAAARPVVELDRLVFVTGGGARRLRR